jgi:hypothetical protein
MSPLRKNHQIVYSGFSGLTSLTRILGFHVEIQIANELRQQPGQGFLNPMLRDKESMLPRRLRKILETILCSSAEVTQSAEFTKIPRSTYTIRHKSLYQSSGMARFMASKEEFYSCRICGRGFSDKTTLVEHLGVGHEVLEIASYAATTMMQEQDRDKVAREFHRQFEQIKKELAGHGL